MAPGSPAARAGVRPGEALLAINGEPVFPFSLGGPCGARTACARSALPGAEHPALAEKLSLETSLSSSMGKSSPKVLCP